MHQQNVKWSWRVGVISGRLLETPRAWEGTPEASGRNSIVLNPPGALTKHAGDSRIMGMNSGILLQQLPTLLQTVGEMDLLLNPLGSCTSAPKGYKINGLAGIWPHGVNK
jgi:hypothetical protein